MSWRGSSPTSGIPTPIRSSTNLYAVPPWGGVVLPAAFGPGARRRDPPPAPAAALWSGGHPAARLGPAQGGAYGYRGMRPAAPVPGPALFRGRSACGPPGRWPPAPLRLRAAPRAAGPGRRGFGVVGPVGPARRYPPRWTRSPSARSCRAGRPAVALRRARVPPVGAAPPGALGGGAPGRGARAGRRRPQAAWVGVAAPRGRPAPVSVFLLRVPLPPLGRGPVYKKREKSGEKRRKQTKIVAKTAHQRYNRGVQNRMPRTP